MRAAKLDAGLEPSPSIHQVFDIRKSSGDSTDHGVGLRDDTSCSDAPARMD